MLCRITDMHSKEVINVCDGMRLGCVDDVEVDTCTAQLVSIVIFGRSKFLGILGREDDIVIRWNEIEVIGEQTILVNHPMPCRIGDSCCRKPHILQGIFGNSR